MARRKINLANTCPRDSRDIEQPWVLSFGAYGNTYVMAYARTLDDALEACAGWIAKHAPGLFHTESVNRTYQEAIAAGKREEDAARDAEMDMTSVLSGTEYLASWEWGIVAENPSPAEIAAMARGA